MRRALPLVLIAIATVLAFLAILAVWANRQALDTENWTETSSKLLEREVIRDELAAFLTDELYANVDVEGELEAVLPKRAAPLAAPAASGLRDVAERGLQKLLERPRTQRLWEDANRVTHRELLKLLEDDEEEVSTADGTVKLDLTQLLSEAAGRVPAAGKLSEKLPPDAGDITILRSDQLELAQDLVHFLKVLAVVLVVLSLLLFAIAVGIAKDRRRETLRASGLGLIVAGVGVLLVHSVAGDAAVEALATTDAVEPAVAATYSIGTSLLVDAAVAAIIYGVLIVAAAWLAGPSRPATVVRRVLAPWLEERYIAYGAVLLAVALVVAWGPTPATRKLLPVLLIVALLLAGVEALRRQAAREQSGAPSA